MTIKFFDEKLERFISGLEKFTIAKVLRTIDLLESFGYNLGMPHSKKISKNLFELRVRGRQEVRFFYTFHGGGIVLLHGFVKKTQKIDRKELTVGLKKLGLLDRI